MKKSFKYMLVILVFTSFFLVLPNTVLGDQKYDSITKDLPIGGQSQEPEKSLKDQHDIFKKSKITTPSSSSSSSSNGRNSSSEKSTSRDISQTTNNKGTTSTSSSGKSGKSLTDLFQRDRYR